MWTCAKCNFHVQYVTKQALITYKAYISERADSGSLPQPQKIWSQEYYTALKALKFTAVLFKM